MKDTFSYAKKPTVFISSTCYDLSQLRESVDNYITEKLGLDVLRSETDKFPTDPSSDTINNCLRAVKERADIFVLILGKRYGYVTDNGKSITHMEYLTATRKGIPKFVFILEEMMTFYKLWKKNPDSVRSEVDDLSIFEFIDELYGTGTIWVYSYTTAKDIGNILHEQILYLFNDSLQIKLQLHKTRMPKRILELGDEIINIILEKNDLWEYNLFNATVLKGLEDLENVKRDLKYGFTFDKRKMFDNPSDILEWMTYKNHELLAISDMMSIFINKALPEAMGENGKDGNPEHLVYCADKFVELYKNVILWGMDFKTLILDNEWKKLTNSLLVTCTTLLNDLDQFVNDSVQEIKKCELALKTKNDEEELVFKISLNLSAPDLTEFNAEMINMAKRYGIQDFEPVEVD